MPNKEISLKIKKINIVAGNGFQILLHEKDAIKLGITAIDDIILKFKIGKKLKSIVVNVDLSNHLVNPGEVGLTLDLFYRYNIFEGDTIIISTFQKHPLSVKAIKKKLLGQKINEEEIKALMQDMTDGKISDLLTAYYIASSFAYPSDKKELFWTAKYSAEMGDMLSFKQDTAVKYCIGGVPGNETTMIIVPILGSLGISSPKLFSKSITSPAATGECVEVLMDTEFSVKNMKKMVNKLGVCLVNGKALNFAPANDKIIKATYPLYMEAYSKIAVSIMAKIYAAGVKYALIELPVGKFGKILDKKTANRVAGHFEYIGKRFGMKVKVVITNADTPVGKGVGAILQTREALRILQNKDNFSKDIRKKVVLLSADILEMVGLAKGKDAIKLVEKQLKSGKAWEYMQKIIEHQNNINGVKPDLKTISYLGVIDSEELPIAKFTANLISYKSGKIKSINVGVLKKACRSFGAPLDKQVGVYLVKQVGNLVKKGDILCELYANNEDDLQRELKYLQKSKKLYKIV